MQAADLMALPFDNETGLSLNERLRRFKWKGAPTTVGELRVETGEGSTVTVETYTNEFWTARQRVAHSLHEVSYRACFKPQLPRFFIDRLTQPGDVVYDPFMGRGTTLIEAALLDRRAYGCDVNPLSRVLCGPRLSPPGLSDVEHALAEVNFADDQDVPSELLVFYHPDTLRQICALRSHLLKKQHEGLLTRADQWVRMVAVNRLTGHSAGFFSVYTLPPNQAVSTRAQEKINVRRAQKPPARDVPAIVLAKSQSLLRDCTRATHRGLDRLAPHHRITVGSASETGAFEDSSVTLAVTSPPFLDIVDYKTDNWLRCWFCGIDTASVRVTLAKQVDAWKRFVTTTLIEVRRLLRPGGCVAFEVGEVRGGALRLEEVVVPAGIAADLEPMLVLVNEQRFTKTANCWGVTNNRKGTNTNRVVVFRKTS